MIMILPVCLLSVYISWYPPWIMFQSISIPILMAWLILIHVENRAEVLRRRVQFHQPFVQLLLFSSEGVGRWSKLFSLRTRSRGPSSSMICLVKLWFSIACYIARGTVHVFYVCKFMFGAFNRKNTAHWGSSQSQSTNKYITVIVSYLPSGNLT